MALQDCIKHVQTRVCSSKIGAISTEQLQYYTQEVGVRESIGHSVSLVDLWGLLIEYFLNQEVREEQKVNTLSPLPAPALVSTLSSV